MGYFSQRKKHARQNMFMLISLVILAIIYLLLWLDDGSSSFLKSLRHAQFHFYLYNLFLVLYTLFHRHLAYMCLAIMLLFCNYGSLAKSALLFFNHEPEGFNQLEVSYHKGEQNYLPTNGKYTITHQGKLELSPHLSAAFAGIENQQDKTIMLINLDFSKKYEAEYQTAFHNLEKFVMAQNGPVVIVGDFGIPSWDILFREFLTDTGLSVKNRILFTDGKSSFRFWFVPSINILGFDNFGIKSVSMKGQTFHIKLGY